MKISDFELYRDLLQRNSGLSLAAEKSYLLDSRLTPIARKWGYPTLEAMTLALRGVPDTGLLNDVVEGMANKDTAFFRDTTPFTTLRDVIMPAIIKSKGRRRELRIWSAGCSTGQEAYSIALMLKDIEQKLKGWKIEILATDLSHEALRKGRSADYTQFEVQRGLPITYLMKYFDEMDNSWRLHDDIRNLVLFEQFNLLEYTDELGLFDIIFCRNVLNSFEDKLRNTILCRLTENMNENGFLVLGEGEGLAGETPLRALTDLPCYFGLQSGKYNLDIPKQPASK